MKPWVENHRPGLGIIGIGALLWIVGALFMNLPTLAFLAAVGAVLITIGQILFWLGIVVLILEVIFGWFRGV